LAQGLPVTWGIVDRTGVRRAAIRFFQPQDGTGPGRHHCLHRTGRHAAGGL